MPGSGDGPTSASGPPGTEAPSVFIGVTLETGVVDDLLAAVGAVLDLEATVDVLAFVDALAVLVEVVDLLAATFAVGAGMVGLAAGAPGGGSRVDDGMSVTEGAGAVGVAAVEVGAG